MLLLSFSVCDGDGNEVLRIIGPWCTFSLCGDVEFKVSGNSIFLEIPFLFSFYILSILFVFGVLKIWQKNMRSFLKFSENSICVKYKC